MEFLAVIFVVGIIIVLAIGFGISHLIEVCEPSEVLVFSGDKSRSGYEIVHAGKKVRNPLFHRVDRMDVTNMVIDLHVTNAYSKGGIPLTVRGVANVKIGSHSPLVNNAVERFLQMNRQQVNQ